MIVHGMRRLSSSKDMEAGRTVESDVILCLGSLTSRRYSGHDGESGMSWSWSKEKILKADCLSSEEYV